MQYTNHPISIKKHLLCPKMRSCAISSRLLQKKSYTAHCISLPHNHPHDDTWLDSSKTKYITPVHVENPGLESKHNPSIFPDEVFRSRFSVSDHTLTDHKTKWSQTICLKNTRKQFSPTKNGTDCTPYFSVNYTLVSNKTLSQITDFLNYSTESINSTNSSNHITSWLIDLTTKFIPRDLYEEIQY